MDKRVLRERMRKKQRQMRRRRMMKRYTSIAAVILVCIFVIRGIIFPIIHGVGGKDTQKQTEVQAETAQKTDTGTTQKSANAAIRQPLKGKNDLTKASQRTVGWHEDTNGKWYQNADGTYYAGGMQEIDGSTYYFNDNGYRQTGWVSVGFDDYYFNDDGTYDPSIHKPRIALTFDDGPGEYTDELLDCLEENNAHATFFMLGQNVVNWESTVQRMADIGCEIGNHTWDHPSQTLTNMAIEDVQSEFQKTDEALINACGQASTVARAPYGAANQEIYDAVQKPFFMWSLDTEDWRKMDADADYDVVMNGDLTDGSIILMHDIHEPSVKAALRLIPDLVAQGYKLVTVSELAMAKNVELQNTTYSQFWDSQLEAGTVPGYKGGTESSDESSSDGDSTDDFSDSSSDDAYDETANVSDGSSDDSGEDSWSDSSGSDDADSNDGTDYEDDSGDDDFYDDSYDDSSGDDGDYADEDSDDGDYYDTGY